VGWLGAEAGVEGRPHVEGKGTGGPGDPEGRAGEIRQLITQGEKERLPKLAVYRDLLLPRYPPPRPTPPWGALHWPCWLSATGLRRAVVRDSTGSEGMNWRECWSGGWGLAR